MKIKFNKNAIKFFEKITEKDKEKLRIKLKKLINYISEFGIISFNLFDIKKLEGEWKGCLRMRVGKIRIIFEIDRKTQIVYIHEIDFRGNIYK